MAQSGTLKLQGLPGGGGVSGRIADETKWHLTRMRPPTPTVRIGREPRAHQHEKGRRLLLGHRRCQVVFYMNGPARLAGKNTCRLCESDEG
jgi:hypothetical protein